MGWLEEWGLKLTSAKVAVEVEAELGKNTVFYLVLRNLCQGSEGGEGTKCPP